MQTNQIMGNYLVVGGSSGIGKALVEQLSEAGHQVYATYNEKEQSSDTVTYKQYNTLTDEFSFDELPTEIDGLAYCPGSINLKQFHRFSADDFIDDYKLQVVGATQVIKAVLPKLKKGNQGSIVLFSTVAVQNGFSFHSLVSSSKGAVEGLTKALAAEFAPKIRVNAIAPSLTDTPLAESLLNNDVKRQNNADKNPLKSIATAQDVANAAHYLLSPESSYVTGQIVAVDGGMSTIKN